jgi:2-polyprenyl-3-methyl-5-hydroxy-6-metoxy-1,4-benzoquinol methylase
MEVNQTQTAPQKFKTAACPICQSKQLMDLLTIQEVPIICNVIWETREEAAAIPRGEIHLAFCEDCGHVFNLAFDPDKMVYDAQYENSLHFSARFQEYAEGLANYLINQYNLHDKKIIEIGSGKGEFLRTLCDLGKNHAIGFDPSYRPSAEDAHPNIQFIQDRYTEKYHRQQADLVLSRHVLEHLPQPAEFVSGLRATIGDHRETVVFMEVPNFSYMLRDTAVWDLIYQAVYFQRFLCNQHSRTL